MRKAICLLVLGGVALCPRPLPALAEQAVNGKAKVAEGAYKEPTVTSYDESNNAKEGKGLGACYSKDHQHPNSISTASWINVSKMPWVGLKSTANAHANGGKSTLTNSDMVVNSGSRTATVVCQETTCSGYQCWLYAVTGIRFHGLYKGSGDISAISLYDNNIAYDQLGRGHRQELKVQKDGLENRTVQLGAEVSGGGGKIMGGQSYQASIITQTTGKWDRPETIASYHLCACGKSITFDKNKTVHTPLNSLSAPSGGSADASFTATTLNLLKVYNLTITEATDGPGSPGGNDIGGPTTGGGAPTGPITPNDPFVPQDLRDDTGGHKHRNRKAGGEHQTTVSSVTLKEFQPNSCSTYFPQLRQGRTPGDAMIAFHYGNSAPEVITLSATGAAVSVPADVTRAVGQDIVTFPITINGAGAAAVRATFEDGSVWDFDATVEAAASIDRLYFASDITTALPGTTFSIYVMRDNVASTLGTSRVVGLSVTDPDLIVTSFPSQVTIPAGSLGAEVTVTLSGTSTGVATVHASSDGPLTTDATVVALGKKEVVLPLTPMTATLGTTTSYRAALDSCMLPSAHAYSVTVLTGSGVISIESPTSGTLAPDRRWLTLEFEGLQVGEAEVLLDIDGVHAQKFVVKVTPN